MIETIVEQEAEDEEVENLQHNNQHRLMQCYSHAQQLTEEMRAKRKRTSGTSQKVDKVQEAKQEKQYHRDNRSHRRKKKRGRRRGRSSSRSRSRSYSSSSGSDRHADQPIDVEESLKQTQQLLLVQQKKLQTLIGKAGCEKCL